MTTLNIYLTFNGNCHEAFDYYRSIFGGEFASISRFSEMPENLDYPIPESDKDKIMHVSLPISKETVLMGSDTASGFGSEIIVGNNFSISVNPESKVEADRIFNDLSSGGNITMPMENAFWGSYFGMCKDKYGINWMVNFDLQSVNE